MPSKTGYTEMCLSTAEVKLILRLRQLRKTTQTCLFMVTTNPMTLAVMGDMEILENPYASGSGAYG